MASNYPGSLDSFDTIASDKKTSDSVGGRTHRQMHNDLGDAIEAVQTELGTTPSGTFSTVKARLDAMVAYATKSGNYTVTTADNILDVNSGTFTLDLPAASTCTGKTFRIKNSGTGVVTLDGNSSEAVEGIATFPLGTGSYVEIASTGSAWVVVSGVADTGWRNLSALLENSWAGTLYVRRVGQLVHVHGSLTGTSASSHMVLSSNALPTGFRPRSGIQRAVSRAATLSDAIHVEITIGGEMALWSGNGDGASQIVSETFLAASTTWPTSLPGTAA